MKSVLFNKAVYISFFLLACEYVHGRSSKSRSAKKSKKETHKSNTISLGNRRPEGTTIGPHSTLYVSHFFWGGVSAIDLKNGNERDIVPDKDFYTRGGMGLAYYKGTLFTGGGGPKGGFPDAKMYVYDAETGDEIAACAPLRSNDDSFMNEVTIKDDKAYVVDSGINELMVVDAEAAIKGDCKVTSISLPDVSDFVAVGDDFWGANGVYPYGDGLLIVTETAGSVWYVDLTTNDVTNVLPAGSAEFGDGLISCADKMYVTQNMKNQISIYSLSGGKHGEDVMAVKAGTLTSPNYKSPATSVIYDGSLYSVNARFQVLGFPETGEDDLDNFDEEFDIAIVPNVFGTDCHS